MIQRPPIQLDLRPYYKGEETGHREKDLIVLHETVSYNKPGLIDIKEPAAYLDAKGYEIHAIIDAEQNSAWCYDPTAVYDHAYSGVGLVNTRSIGIELVSEIPLKPSPLRYQAWLKRRKQLDRLAWWVAWLCQQQSIPIKYSDSSMSEPGITSHWDVSQTWNVTHGHWDCWPKHKGGHFPMLYVVNKAQQIRDAGNP